MLKKIKRAIRFHIKLCIDTLRLSCQVLGKNFSHSILLCISSPGSVGGTEFQVNKIAESLAQLGKSPLVLITGKIEGKKNHLFLKRLEEHQIPYLFLGNLGLTQNRIFQKWAAFLIKRFHASFCQFFNPASTGLIPAAKRAGLKILYMETGMPDRDPWWNPLLAHIPSIDLAVGISQASLNRLRTFCHYSGPATVFYSLIDPPPAQLVWQSAGQGEFKIVYFGRIYRGKGVVVLLQAFRKLVLRCPFAELTFIGEGSDKKNLQRQVADWNIEKQIHFLGFQDKEELLRKLATFDVFCLPSFSEGTPCSILEAMSIGLPVIASRVGGIPEIIEDRITGLLVPPDDPQALTDALELLAKDRQLCKQIASNGRDRYLNCFSPERSLSRLTTAVFASERREV